MVAFNTILQSLPPPVESEGITVTPTAHGTTVIDCGRYGTLELPTPPGNETT